jgi:hypothetical protein
MDEDVLVQESSVNEGELAGSNEGVDNPENNTEVNPGSEGEVQEENNTGASEGEVNSEGIETSKAFAERLSKKTKAIEQQFQEKYGKYVSTFEREAAKYGLTPDEYLAEIEKQQADEEAERERQADLEKYGEMPPEQLDRVKKADAIIQKQKEQEKWIEEVKDFRKAFPDIKSSEEIPEEVYLTRETEGCSLLTAYEAYQFRQSKQNQDKLKIEAEQAAIKNLKKNQVTPGSLTKELPDNSEINFSKMPDAEFEKMIEAVKMGKLKF